jgi:hypothetical protein
MATPDKRNVPCQLWSVSQAYASWMVVPLFPYRHSSPNYFFSREDTDVGFYAHFNGNALTPLASLKSSPCQQNLIIMNRVAYRGIANDRMAARLRQVLVLFLAVVAGILLSVSINF